MHLHCPWPAEPDGDVPGCSQGSREVRQFLEMIPEQQMPNQDSASDPVPWQEHLRGGLCVSTDSQGPDVSFVAFRIYQAEGDLAAGHVADLPAISCA